MSIRPQAKPVVVGFDESVIRIWEDGKKSVELPWSDLESVAYWSQLPDLLIDDGAICVLRGRHLTGPWLLPSESKGLPELELKLKSLPGFDVDAYFQARLATEATEFLCWRRPVEKPESNSDGRP